jgi:hypothetical protein
MEALVAMATPPTDEEFRTFLQSVKDDVGVADFVQVVGTDLLGAKIIADFGTPPNPLQLAKLTRTTHTMDRLACLDTRCVFSIPNCLSIRLTILQ